MTNRRFVNDQKAAQAALLNCIASAATKLPAKIRRRARTCRRMDKHGIIGQAARAGRLPYYTMFVHPPASARPPANFGRKFCRGRRDTVQQGRLRRLLIVDKPSVCQRGSPGRLQIKDLRPATGSGMHFSRKRKRLLCKKCQK